MSDWISVKDRLPEENEEVIIYCKDWFSKNLIVCAGDYYLLGGEPRWNTKEWDGCGGFEPALDVTHWQPLPTPPEDLDKTPKP